MVQQNFMMDGTKKPVRAQSATIMGNQMNSTGSCFMMSGLGRTFSVGTQTLGLSAWAPKWNTTEDLVTQQTNGTFNASNSDTKLAFLFSWRLASMKKWNKMLSFHCTAPKWSDVWWFRSFWRFLCAWDDLTGFLLYIFGFFHSSSFCSNRMWPRRNVASEVDLTLL